MIRVLKALSIFTMLISLSLVAIAAMMFSAGTVKLWQAALIIISFGSLLYISYGAYQEIKALKTRPGSRKTKGANVNTQLNYTPEPVNYASSFRLGEPVVTTEEYYDGAGYHAFIEKFDRSDIGRPFKIRMCGNLGFDWVSSDEIKPDRELEASL